MTLERSGRVIVYPNEIPSSGDVLRSNMYRMVDVSELAATVLGVGLNYPVQVRDLACTQTSPPSLQVAVGTGVLYAQQVYDATDYGTIPADTTDVLYKQAVSFGGTLLTCPVPVNVGDSVIHLVEAIFQTVDANPTSRPYFNSANPPQPLFQTQSDTRQDIVNIVLKPGIASVSPSPPAPDAGYVGLYYIHVTHGQTTILNSDITKVPNAPFITESLPMKLSQTSADARYVKQSDLQEGAYYSANDTGSVNAIVVTPSPAYSAYLPYSRITVKVANTNTGAVTLNISGLGAIAVKKHTDSGLAALTGNELIAGSIYTFIYDGTQFQLMNPEFPQADTGSGYIILAGGLIMQWGSYLLTAPGTPTGLAIISYPIPFPNNVFTITTSYGEDADPTFLELTTQAKPIDNSTFKFAIGTCGTAINITQDIPLQWIALGN